MVAKKLRDRYFESLKAYYLRPEEKYLYRTSRLARELVLADVPPEDVAEVHDEALTRLKDEMPAVEELEAVRLTSMPLIELLMAYGLAYRERQAARERAEETLRKVGEGTSAAIGADFFPALVRRLVAATGAHVAFVAELVDPVQYRACTRAIWLGEGFAENFSWDLTDTPCERVVGGQTVLFVKDVQAAFPDDQWLVDVGAESYLGIPLTDTTGKIIGHMGILDSKPIPAPQVAEGIMQIFAARAGAELERERMNEALERAAQEWRRTFDTMNDMVTIHDHDFHIVRANRPAARAFGYEPADLVGKPCYQVFHNRDRCVEDCPFPRSQQTQKTETAEIWEPSIGKWLQVTINPFRDSRGKVIGAVHVMRDITAQKEAALALQQSENKYRALFEYANDSIFIVDPETFRFLDVNNNAASQLGYSREELLQKTVADIGLPMDTAPDHTAVRQQLQEVGSALFERVHLRKDGTQMAVEISSRMIEFGGRQVIQSFVRDITRRKQAEQALQEYSERLEEMVEERTRELHKAHEELVQREKLATLGRLAAGVAHEMRNPLGVIANAIYYLKTVQPDVGENIREYLELISSEVHRATQIMTDLLDFSGAKITSREKVAAASLVAAVLEKHPPPGDVQVSIEIPSDLPPAFVDPRQIEQVLGNVVTNAYQAMPEGGRLSVTGEQCSVISDRYSVTSDESSELITADRARITGNWLLITVRDTGVGISPEHMGKLFEPLFTTRARGIGLGLALARNLVEANGGRIEAESEEGKGSAFTVWLPLAGSQ